VTERDQPSLEAAADVARAVVELARYGEGLQEPQVEPQIALSAGHLSIDLSARTVRIDGDDVEMTAREFDLLAFLCARAGHVFSRNDLVRHVWLSTPEWQNPATVTEHIYRLRAKVEVDPAHPRLIKTVRRAGYRFDSPDGADHLAVARPLNTRSSAVGTILQVGTRIVAADRGALQLFGAAGPGDVVGRDVFDLIAPSSQAATRARAEMRSAGQAPGPQVISMIRADGTHVGLLVRSRATTFQGQAALGAELREIDDPPQLIRSLVTGVSSEVSDAVIVTDPEFHVLSWNRAAERLYGWTEAEVLGHSMQNVVRFDESQHDLDVAWHELQTTNRWHHEVRQITRDGSAVTVLASVNLIRDEDGDVRAIVGVNRPVPPRDVRQEIVGGSRAPRGVRPERNELGT
jgi:PAS domain S-box-containing protein